MLIGEVSRRAGISRRMLRHYDSLGLVVPSGRSATGYREYAEADVRRLLHVEALRTLGLSLAEVGRALRDPEDADAGRTLDALIAQTRERIGRERETLARLERLAAAGPADWAEVLGAIAGVAALRGDDPAARQRAALDASAGAIDADELVGARLAETDANVAGALDWALARAGEPAAAALAAAARSEDPEQRRSVLRALAALSGASALPASSLPSASSASSAPAVPNAPTVPPLHGGDVAEEALERLLDDAEPDIRSRAALALAGRGGRRAREELLAMLVEGRSDVEAAEALADLAGGEAGEDELVGEYRALLADPSTPVESRRRLVQALAELGDGPAARAALEANTADPDEQVSLTAKAILATRGR